MEWDVPTCERPDIEPFLGLKNAAFRDKQIGLNSKHIVF